MKCACGKPLHYENSAKQKRVEELTKDLGEYIPVSAWHGGKKYMVQRHYIALHGLKAAELPDIAERLGFKEVLNKN